MTQKILKAIHPRITPATEITTRMRDLFATACEGMFQECEDLTSNWNPENQPAWNIKRDDNPEDLLITIEAVGDIFSYVEKGTKPHIITPTNARALVFTPTGQTTPVFTKKVHHPGFEGRHSLAPIAKKWKAKINRLMKKNLRSTTLPE